MCRRPWAEWRTCGSGRSARSTPPGGGALLAIGEPAELAAKRPSSIRYHEQIGLLPGPLRVAGQRKYDPGTVRTLAVIETGQRAGLTLDEIKMLLSASPGFPASGSGSPTKDNE